MSVQLLDKTRKINKLLHNNNSTKVVFNDICKVMMETLDSNILVISKKGKVLGVSPKQIKYPIPPTITVTATPPANPLIQVFILSVISVVSCLLLSSPAISQFLQKLIHIQRGLPLSCCIPLCIISNHLR